MSLVAGVDSSTQSCTIVVCDVDSGEVVRTSRAPHPPGTEVPAQAWLDAFQQAARDPGLLADVKAMAVGGQQHGMVALDEAGEPVRDALLWNDNRSALRRPRSDRRTRRSADLGGPGRIGACCSPHRDEGPLARSSGTRAGGRYQVGPASARLVDVAAGRAELRPDD